MASATADFERIYRRHARDVYRFALSVVRNPLEAEDVTQTTFLNAYRALERGDRPDRPRSWLLAIAHNAIRSRDRWRRRRPPEVPLDVAEYRLAAQSDDTPAVGALLDALGDLHTFAGFDQVRAWEREYLGEEAMKKYAGSVGHVPK